MSEAPTPFLAPFLSACVTMRAGRDPQVNIETAAGLIREAAGKGAQFVFTPENTLVMELERERIFAICKPEEETEGLKVLAALAGELGIWLSIGSMAIRLSDEKLANRSFLVSPRGDIVARYDKIHMFDVELPNGERYRESKNYQPGGNAMLAQTDFGPIGLTICYDMRFPELYRDLAKAGALYLTAPSAFTQVTGEAHWHVLLRARAIETGCFMFAAAQSGTHENGRATYGHSLIVDPWGVVLADGGTEVGVITAEIDPAKVAEARTRLPSLTHDRPYSVTG